MEFRIAVDPGGFVRCVFEGELDLGAAKLAWRKASSLAFEQGRGVLYDARRARNRCSYPSLYRFAHDREQSHERASRSTCRIAILSQENVDSVRWAFLVFAAQNYGPQMRLFHEEAAAVGWLTS
ncbi:MAG TPA: hypothetical protein VF943_05110 [Burkholderiales bacterium]